MSRSVETASGFRAEFYLPVPEVLIKPAQDPLMWNLSQGLLQLTEALEQDIRAVKKKLADMESTVNNIR